MILYISRTYGMFYIYFLINSPCIHVTCLQLMLSLKLNHLNIHNLLLICYQFI